MRPTACLPIAVAALLAAAVPAAAAGGPRVDVVARGLDNPRHVAVGPSGEVYVAEAGKGGDPATSKSCFDSDVGPACTGATGAVTRVDRRHGQERVATGLASFAAADGTSAIGPHGVSVAGRKVLFTNGGPTGPTRGTPPELLLRDPTLVTEDPVSALFGRVMALQRDGEVDAVADIWAFERGFNSDAQLGNPKIDSNAVDVLYDRGHYVVADAGGNDIVVASRRGETRALTVFPNTPTPGPGGATIPMQTVPTGVVQGPDGAYYVSQLTGFPFPVGGARVFRVDAGTGAATVYARGFTNAMDLDFGPDGTLYVLEIDHNSLLAPGKEGAIFAVPPGGGTPERIALPAGTLTEPGGIAVDRRGRLLVSNHSREAGAGQVLRLRLRR
jgi:hypothetical protein